MPFRIENLYIPPVPPIQLSFVPKNTAQLCDLDMNYFNMVSIAGLVKTKVGTENLEKLLKDINNLNNCIEHYNQLQCYDTYLFYRDCKIIGLRYIEESAQAMDDSFDDQTILYLPHYQNYIYDELLSAIQKQKKLLCISFQYEKLSFLTPRTSFDLKESVHLLSYNQVSILITLLAKRVPFTTSLFIDPHFPYDFQSVWSLYELQFIHAGNSICYTMRRTFDTSESYYLKVENYLNHHKAVERRLRKKLSTVPELSDFILPIYAECRARYFHPDDYYTMGRLVLSSYCNQKDLKRYIKKNNKKNKVLPHFVLKVMLLLIEKISIILAHGFISTDLKLSNILVNENPDTQAISLHISDCKSFQQYDTNTGVLNYTNIIVTADHRPPEIIMRTDAIYNKVDAEAVVVYLVGRMLQEGLFLYNQNNPKTENIDPVDKKISHLIRRMLSIQPHKRPKIASVQKSI